MKSSVLLEIILIASIVALASSSHASNVSAATSYVPGVKIGDKWSYGDFLEICTSPCSPSGTPNLNNTSAFAEVTAVSGSNVTVSLTSSSGNTTTTVSTWNVATWTGRVATITGPPLLIAAGLGQGDPVTITPTSATINETIFGSYAGATREVDVINSTRSSGSTVIQRATYWDKATGVLLEDRFAYSGFFIDYKLTRTNLWAGLPDFTISAFPDFVIIPSSPSNNTFIQLPIVTLTSVGNFTGPVELVARVGPSGLVVRFDISNNSTATLLLPPNGMNQTALVPDEFPAPTPGTYFVSVTGFSGLIAHSVNVTMVVRAPGCGPSQCGFEALNLENFSFISNTNVALDLRNTGNSSLTLVTYYVKDAQGDQYSNTGWNGPTILANTAAFTAVAIGSSCPSCTLSGSAFTFTLGNAYTVTVVTSRNNTFTFTVVPGSFAGDFGITANPSQISFTIPADPFPHFSAITLTSLAGFSGNVALTATVFPINIQSGNGTFFRFQVAVNPSSVNLAAGSIANATLAVSDQGAPPGFYAVNVTGTSGLISHSAIVTLEVVAASPDFELALSAPPGGPVVIAGQTTAIGVYLVNSSPFPASFNGTVTVTAQVLPLLGNGPIVSFNPNHISFQSSGTPFSTVTMSTSAATPPGNYTVLITGSSGTLVHEIEVSLRVLPAPVITANPSSGSLGTMVTVHGSGFFVPPGGPFAFPVELEMTLDDQFIGFIFLTNSTFDFTFNVPHADPTKPHLIHAIEPFPMTLDVQTGFTVLPEPSPVATLTISVSTGPIYFPSETVTIYVQTTQNGSPVASTVQLQLIRPDGTSATLNTPSVSTGLYKATYNVPRTGATGTYAIVASASTNGQSATTLATFEVKTPWVSTQSGRTTTTGLALIGIVGLLAVASWKWSWRKLDEDDEKGVSLQP